jgi:drug/metabolite transporter (DMT)-like permease
MHLIIFVWGFTGILGKLIQLEALTLVWWRILIALISLYIGLKFLKIPIKIKSKKHLLLSLFVGCLVAAHWLTFYISIQLSTASLGILCLSTATLHVSWLEPLIMRKKFSWLEFSLGLIVIYGIYIVSSNFSAKDYEALIYGLFSALAAAAFTVFNGKLSQSISAAAITFHEMLMGLVILSIALLFQGKLNMELFVMTSTDFAWLLFLGILCTSVAFLLTVEIVKKLGAFTVSLSINLEPIYTMILAIIILNENQLLSNQFYFGAVLIIVVVIANPLLKKLIKLRNNRNTLTRKIH